MERAASVSHVEYEVITWLRDNIDLASLKQAMSVDEITEKRWTTGVANVCELLDNMCNRRTHKLPKTHTEYKEKVKQ
tara:strand:+ start:10195 stop:10425 length:231 start_codon:yes stop_codon:yes gene_type:complete